MVVSGLFPSFFSSFLCPVLLSFKLYRRVSFSYSVRFLCSPVLSTCHVLSVSFLSCPRVLHRHGVFSSPVSSCPALVMPVMLFLLFYSLPFVSRIFKFLLSLKDLCCLDFLFCPVLPCSVTPCPSIPVLSYPILSCSDRSCSVIFCTVLSCHVSPYPFLSSHVRFFLSRPVLFFPVLL